MVEHGPSLSNGDATGAKSTPPTGLTVMPSDSLKTSLHFQRWLVKLYIGFGQSIASLEEQAHYDHVVLSKRAATC
jgi:hypothetical protein